MTISDRLINLARLIRQLLNNSRIVRFLTGQLRKTGVEEPPDRRYTGNEEPVLFRHFDSENLKPIHDQIPNETRVDTLDTERNIFDSIPDPDIDFSQEIDLESYTKNLNVPRGMIERWVAAGILRPDEIEVAEKMLKIMRKEDSDRKKRDPNSTS